MTTGIVSTELTELTGTRSYPSLNQTVLDIWKVLRSGWTHSQISIPRQLTTSYNYSSVKLLLFSDASKEYYAAVAYLHYEFPDQTSQTNILMYKSKIKPNNTETYILNTCNISIRTIDDEMIRATSSKNFVII
uniref:Uncharacterized protein n=1 Tax=Caenorhabditis japonica TaxID=281687 RepID=A0A8R1I9J0_CAEJA